MTDATGASRGGTRLSAAIARVRSRWRAVSRLFRPPSTLRSRAWRRARPRPRTAALLRPPPPPPRLTLLSRRASRRGKRAPVRPRARGSSGRQPRRGAARKLHQRRAGGAESCSLGERAARCCHASPTHLWGRCAPRRAQLSCLNRLRALRAVKRRTSPQASHAFPASARRASGVCCSTAICVALSLAAWQPRLPPLRCVLRRAQAPCLGAHQLALRLIR